VRNEKPSLVGELLHKCAEMKSTMMRHLTMCCFFGFPFCLYSMSCRVFHVEAQAGTIIESTSLGTKNRVKQCVFNLQILGAHAGQSLSVLSFASDVLC
jgi:hypothetical protein